MTAPRAVDLPVGSIVAVRTYAWVKYADGYWFATGNEEETDDAEPQKALDNGAQVLRVGDRSGQ